MKVFAFTLFLVFLSAISAKAADIVIAEVTGIHGKEIGSYSGVLGADFLALERYLKNDTNLEVQSLPAARAYRLFYKNLTPCVTPGSVEVNTKKEKIIGSKAITTIRWVVFSHSKPITNNLEGFEKQLVGIPYDRDGMKNILPEGDYNYIVNHNNYSLATQLLRGRISAMVMVWEEYLTLVKESPDFEDLLNGKDNPLYIQKLGVICNESPKNQEIIDIVNQFIDSRQNAAIR